jgi:signal transduction histidine kinase
LVSREISGETSDRPGERRTWLKTYASIRKPDSHIIGVNVVVQEVTEQLRGEQLLRLNDRLEAQAHERTKDLVEKQHQLRSLALELTLAEDRARRRLATAIHDNLSQLLAQSKLKLEQTNRMMAVEQLWERLMEVNGLLDQALTTTRTITIDLRPPLLGDANDLSGALNWVATTMGRNGLTVTFTEYGEPKPLDDDVLVVIYQAVQELLWNVLKHAGTTDASIPSPLTRLAIRSRLSWRLRDKDSIRLNPSSHRRITALVS